MTEPEERQRADTLIETALSSAFFRRLYSWGPAVLWMVGIFFFSSRSAPLGPVSDSPHSGLIGRASHIAEYAGLTGLLYRALGRERERHATPLSFAIALAYAVFDELHQELVPGRQCTVADIGYDALGALLVLLCIWMWRVKRGLSQR